MGRVAYIPHQYWSIRETPNSGTLPLYVVKYIRSKLKGETLLDYGPGTGRLFHLYSGMKVTGLDFVGTYTDQAIGIAEDLSLDYAHIVGTIEDADAHYDCIIASKVLLHVLPENIESVITGLADRCGRLIVWDMQCDDPAPHNFSHDYDSMVKMEDIIQNGKELLFICE